MQHMRSLFATPEQRVSLLALGTLAPTLLLLAAMPQRNIAYYDKGFWLFLLVTAMFVAAEPLVFHVEARNEAVSFSPTDLPLALGLLMLSPLSLVAARLLGSGLGLLIWRRPPLFKLTLNLTAFAAETLIAVLVFRTLFDAVESASPILWVGMIISLLVGLISAGIVIATAISIFEGDTAARVRKELSHSYLFYLPGAVLGASFAIPILVDPWLIMLFAAPAPLVWLILRSHGNLMHRFTDLRDVHEFSSQVGRSAHLEEIAETAVSEIASHLRATAVALAVWDHGAGSVRSHHGDLKLGAFLPHGPEEVEWISDIGSSAPLIVDASTDDELGRWLAGLDIEQALVVALHADERPIGLLVVAGRQGVVDRFGEDDRARLRPISDQLAVALRKGQLHVQIQHDATHDRLTGLPNRAYFEAWLGQAIQADDSEQVAVLMIDLDRFKEVNDTLGHHAGDMLLIEVAKRLSDALEDEDFAARFGGDEFAVIAPGAGQDAASLLAEKISQRLELPFEIMGSSLAIAASVGIALAPDHGTDGSLLLRRADLAMYDAKRCHERSIVYTSSLEGQDSVRLAMLGDLRQTLASSSLDVYYQPKTDLRSGQVVAVEALARWNHPTHGQVSPEIFVPLAEQAGLIEELTDQILTRSLQAVEHWAENGYEIGVAVNLSPHSLLNEDLPQRIAGHLERAGVDGSMLTIEITEQSVIGDVPRSVRILERLHRLGVAISIDDFGTGHSSLTNLRYLPITELKIDRSFVAEMLLGHHDEVIVKSTIDLGHNLGYKVVAEGVETTDIQERLGFLGCDLAQGFGVCRPLPIDELDEWLRNVQPARGLRLDRSGAGAIECRRDHASRVR